MISLSERVGSPTGSLEMSMSPPTAVVVDGDDGVVVLLGHRADGVVDPLLHFGVGPLNGVEFYGIGIFSCGDGGYCSSAHADTVVVASHEDDVVSLRGAVLGGVGLLGVANTSGEHHDLVIAVLALGAVGILFSVLKGLEGAADEGLAELVAEVGGTVGCLDKNLRRGLVQPLAGRTGLPFAAAVDAWVGGHVDGGTGYGEGTLAASDTVAYLSSAAGGRSVERLYGGGEIVGLGLQRDDGLDLLFLEEAGLGGRSGVEEPELGTLDEGAVVLVCGDDAAGIDRRGLLYQLEE